MECPMGLGSPIRVAWVAFLSLTASCLVAKQEEERANQDAPRVIVLGFDGLDHALVARWSAAGALPNLKQLAKDGAFLPLEPTNPASSPVAWASLLTGTNPGQTNIFCFVKRDIRFDSNGQGRMSLALTGTQRLVQEAHSLLAENPALRGPLEAYFGADALEAGNVLDSIESEFVGTTFLKDAHVAGKRVVGLRVPLAFPTAHEWSLASTDGRARILAGLFTPDIADGPGKWFIVTNDEFASTRPLHTNSGGTCHRADPDTDGFGVALDVVTDREFERSLASLQLDWEEREERIRHPGTQLRCTITPDFDARRATIRHAQFTITLEEGEWSERLPVSFTLASGRERRGIVEMHLSKCRDGVFRIYIPPIAIAPDDVDPLASFAFPSNYAEELAQAIGPYRTIGWASPTNAMKDGEVPRSVFESGIERAFADDEALLEHELASDRFDLLFAAFHAADHAGHLSHDAEHDGDEVSPHALKDDPFLASIYRRIDALVGRIRTRIDAGEWGDNVSLVVVSDHGMVKFEIQANLSRWLEQEGYLVRNPSNPSPGVDLFPRNFDPSSSRAYTLGLGKIYLNLVGREPEGIVAVEERQALAREIAAKLEAWRDPTRGNARIVRRAYLASELYTGPYADAEADIVLGFAAPYRVAWESALGGFGEDDSTSIQPNTEPWIGDHCSVDPSLVPGVCFLYRRGAPLAFPHNHTTDARPIDIRSIAPTILALLGLEGSPAHECAPISR